MKLIVAPPAKLGAQSQRIGHQRQQFLATTRRTVTGRDRFSESQSNLLGEM
jgi:hypothetical protein